MNCHFYWYISGTTKVRNLCLVLSRGNVQTVDCYSTKVNELLGNDQKSMRVYI